MTFDTTTIAIIVAVLAVLILGFILMRPRKQRIERSPDEPKGYAARQDRPYVRPPPHEGGGVPGEVAAAATDVAGEVLNVDAHGALSGAPGEADDLTRLKGVGPKFAARLHELGITRYAQLGSLNVNEVAMLDEKLGPFRGRLARDRVTEQADYLARGDTDGFEAKFGSLGG